MAQVLPAGTEITCPNCDDIIGVAKEAIGPGFMTPSQFELEQPGHETGKAMVCARCGAKFAGWMIHTSEGWK